MNSFIGKGMKRNKEVDHNTFNYLQPNNQVFGSGSSQIYEMNDSFWNKEGVNYSDTVSF